MLPHDREAMLDVLATVNMTRVPSPEMPDFGVGHWYVAEAEGRVVVVEVDQEEVAAIVDLPEQAAIRADSGAMKR